VAQKNLERNQPGSPAHQTGKNPGSNSGLPQEAEGNSDPLSKCTLITTFFVVKLSFKFKGQDGSTVLCESM
jgi:hypothetical protein